MEQVEIIRAYKGFNSEKLAEAAEVLADAFRDESVTQTIYDYSKPAARDTLVELTLLGAKLCLDSDQPLFLACRNEEIVGLVIAKEKTGISVREKINSLFPEVLRLFVPAVKSLRFRAVVSVGKLVRFGHPPADNYYTVEALGVRRDCRRMGLGKKLLSEVENVSRESEMSEGVYLFTADEENKSFYRHLGYRILEEKSNDRLRVWHMFKDT